MLIRMLTSGNSIEEILIQVIVLAIALVIVLPVHEFAHSYVAFKMGDESQKVQGRMTLNPLKHLDPIGAICLLLTGFGWAKPVYVNSSLFNRGGRFAGMWVSAAGPISNLIVGFLFCGLAVLFQRLTGSLEVTATGAVLALNAVMTLLMTVFQVSINLAVLNLIPVPPFDGYGILSAFLPEKAQELIRKNQRYISLLFMVLLVTGALSTPIGYLSYAIQKLMLAVFGISLQ